MVFSNDFRYGFGQTVVMCNACTMLLCLLTHAIPDGVEAHETEELPWTPKPGGRCRYFSGRGRNLLGWQVCRTKLAPENVRKLRGVQKSIGNKVPWKIGMLIYLPVTSRPLISLQKEAILSPCNFATTHLTACILILNPLNFVTHETEDPFATPQNVLTRYEKPKGPGRMKNTTTY